MKPTLKSASETGARRRPQSGPLLPKLLAFGAHPDDIEFGCGGIIARETRNGRAAHFVICSRGESGTNGTTREREAEARKSAALLGASLEFLDLGGDAHFEVQVKHALKLAKVLRRMQPDIVLAPSLAPNQHPDHPRLGQLVRDATRLARYGGVKELRAQRPCVITHLFYYAVTPEAEASDLARILVDVSDPEVLAAWTAAMETHASQARTRNYVELQLTRARLNGLRAGIGHAIPLFPNDALVIDSLAVLGRGARAF